MNPIVKYTTDENDVLSFTLSNTNVSIANSIRRIILSEIDLVVFKPFPYENGNCTLKYPKKICYVSIKNYIKWLNFSKNRQF